MSKIYLKLSGIVGTIGVLVVSIGEFLMLYSPNGGYGGSTGYQNFLYPSIERLQVGFFLAVLAVPVYILVYDHIANMLNVTKRLHWVIEVLAVIGFTIGNVWLGTNAYIGFIVQQIAHGVPLQETLSFLNKLSDPLLQIVRLVVLSLSGIIMWKILEGRTNYPKWIALFAPVLTILYIFLLYVTMPEIGGLLLPAALNFAHLLFMFISTVYAFKTQRD